MGKESSPSIPPSAKRRSAADLVGLATEAISGIGFGSVSYGALSAIPNDSPDSVKLFAGLGLILAGVLINATVRNELNLAANRSKDQENSANLLFRACDDVLRKHGHEKTNAAGQKSIVTNDFPVIYREGREEHVSIYEPLCEGGGRKIRIGVTSFGHGFLVVEEFRCTYGDLDEKGFERSHPQPAKKDDIYYLLGCAHEAMRFLDNKARNNG